MRHILMDLVDFVSLAGFSATATSRSFHRRRHGHLTVAEKPAPASTAPRCLLAPYPLPDTVASSDFCLPRRLLL